MPTDMFLHMKVKTTEESRRCIEGGHAGGWCERVIGWDGSRWSALETLKGSSQKKSKS